MTTTVYALAAGNVVCDRPTSVLPIEIKSSIGSAKCGEVNAASQNILARLMIRRHTSLWRGRDVDGTNVKQVFYRKLAPMHLYDLRRVFFDDASNGVVYHDFKGQILQQR